MAVEASLANALNMLRGGQPTDALAGLRVGQSVDATVLAKLDTGEIRLALLGTLLDIVSATALDVGEPLRLTVVDRSGQLSVALERLDPRPAPAPLPEAQPAPVRALGPAAPQIRPESAEPAPVSSPVTVSATPLRPAGEPPPPAAAARPVAAPWIDPTALAAALATPKTAPAASTAAPAPAQVPIPPPQGDAKNSSLLPGAPTPQAVAALPADAPAPAVKPSRPLDGPPPPQFLAGALPDRPGAPATRPDAPPAAAQTAAQAPAVAPTGQAVDEPLPAVPGDDVPAAPAVGVKAQPSPPSSPVPLLVLADGAEPPLPVPAPADASDPAPTPPPGMAQPAKAGDPPVTARSQLTPDARQALQAMVPEAVAGQASRAPLLADAAAVLASPAGNALPKSVRQMLMALVATALDPATLTAPALRQAIAASGTFQEASILRLAGRLLEAAAPSTAEPAGAAPTGKLPAALPQSPELSQPELLADDVTALRADTKSLLLALRSILPGLSSALISEPASQNASPLSSPSLPRLDAVPAGQPAAAADPSLRDHPEKAAQSLLGATEAALDRVRLLQAASMPDNPKPADGPQRFDRLVEVPLALPNGQIPIMSLAVGRDGRAANAGQAPAWRMRLSLDLPPSGPMHALISLRGGRAAVTLWAEKTQTADQFRAALPELRDALHVVDLDIDSLEVLTGAPPGSRQVRAGKAVDRRS